MGQDYFGENTAIGSSVRGGYAIAYFEVDD
jgi:hypothetical protein